MRQFSLDALREKYSGKIANGVIRHAVHRLQQVVLYFQNVIRLHGARVNVPDFYGTRKC